MLKANFFTQMEDTNDYSRYNMLNRKGFGNNYDRYITNYYSRKKKKSFHEERSFIESTVPEFFLHFNRENFVFKKFIPDLLVMTDILLDKLKDLKLILDI